MSTLSLTLRRVSLLAPAFLFVLAWQAQAVTFTLASAGPPTWTYNLTFAAEDNCNLPSSPTTITLTGLTGVTAAGAPTTTSFTGGLATSNLNWNPTFTSTSVTWTNPTCGSGNFPVPMTVNGFTFTAAVVQAPTATVTTHNFALDTTPPTPVDISGPVPTTSGTGVPVMSPVALLMTMIGLGCAGAYEARRRFQDWFGNQSNQA